MEEEEEEADERRENEASREENIMGIYPLERSLLRGKNGAIKDGTRCKGVGGLDVTKWTKHLQ
jgi:hypothetical protein